MVAETGSSSLTAQSVHPAKWLESGKIDAYRGVAANDPEGTIAITRPKGKDYPETSFAFFIPDLPISGRLPLSAII